MHLLDEHILTLGQAAEETHVSYWTIYGWARRECRGGITLETVRLGGKVFTSREALKRFADRFDALDQQEPASRPNDRRRASSSETPPKPRRKKRIRLTAAHSADIEADELGL